VSAVKVILAAAAVGIALVVISRSSAGAGTSPAAPAPGAPAGTKLEATFAPLVPPLPGIGPAVAVIKPIADNVTTPIINGLNNGLKSVGAVGPVQLGGSPYGPLVKNTDGTFTDGTGAKITPNADGTYTRSLPPSQSNWYTRNVGEPASQAGTAVVHLVSGLL
jgi:hypothetical protein